ACMLWHDVVKRRDKLRAQGEMPMPALLQAIDQVFDARIGDISGRGKLAADMREIWMMQPRFERRTPSTAEALAAQPRFRAGFDYLALRAEAGEADPTLAQWWGRYAGAVGAERQGLLDAARQEDQSRRQTGQDSEAAAPAKKRRRRRKPAGAGGGTGGGEGASSADAGSGDAD
ncbi:MAG: polynucleotide adenylyltransferase PcnB, partial [Burkholderiaceae bacterium]|nr:polynucleotide adenylyltransferase PcnB [Burkholderiaceae bacterium]